MRTFVFRRLPDSGADLEALPGSQRQLAVADSLHFVPRLPRQRYHRVVGGESSPLTRQYTVVYQ
jgi:hypothetical protein